MTASVPREYIVQPGDTLSAIAAVNGVSLESLLTANTLLDPDVLSVGQVILLPEPPNELTPDMKLLPDSRLVRSPDSAAFDISGFIRQQPGFIRMATDIVNTEVLTASEIVERVSLEYSVDARLLLALLEYKAGWLSQMELSDTAKTYPLEGRESPPGFDRAGLYKQLAWAANQLNRGYYGWKYRGLRILEFEDGTRLLYAPALNAATVAVQFFLSLNRPYTDWFGSVLPEGFYRTYSAHFGDPLIDPLEPLVPAGLTQPELALPFSPGETWFFTGGPHGGWGSGSAWSAIDFAPPDDRPDSSPLCYVSDYWATAVAPGVIARSDEGSVILDLDMDGNEATGWTVLYLHMAGEGRIQPGAIVQAGDRIGRPSCEGGFSTATHMHIARRYNGEWIPVSCDACPVTNSLPPFTIGSWTVFGYAGQEYQGYMVNGAEQRAAEQGRLTPVNRVSW